MQAAQSNLGRYFVDINDDRMAAQRVEQSVPELALEGKAILITGSARRIGAALARACARAGANVVIHSHHSGKDAIEIQAEIVSMERRAWVLQADLEKADEVSRLMDLAAERTGGLYALVNNAAVQVANYTAALDAFVGVLA